MRVVGTRIPTVGEDRKIYSTVDSTATAGQTVFSVNYDEGKVACWLNGIRLVQGQDFTYTASGVGSQITLSSGIVANDYVEVVGYQGIYSGNALVEDRFVVGTSSTGSGGSYTNSTTVFPVASNTGDLVCVYRNGIKLVHTTDFTVQPTASTVTLQSASNTADEITVHVIGILQHSNFVPVTGGTFTGTVAHTGTLDVSGGTLTTSTAQKTAIVDGGKGNLTKSDVGLSNVTNDAQVPASGGTFTGNVSFGDSIKAQFGASNDLQILHDGSHSYINDAGTGNLYIQATSLRLNNGAGTSPYMQANDGSDVKLFHNGSEKLATASTGVNISDNLLVGKTVTTQNTAGTQISATTGVRATVDGNVATILNRTSSDGTIADFRKDGTTVGSIGAEGSDHLTIGTGDTGFLFSDGHNAIHPWNISSNATRDNAIDLGRSSHRFKDLYLSGGIEFGGSVNSGGTVSSSNLLDDYEEGTWTPTWVVPNGSITANSNKSGFYRKIGNVVYIWGYISWGGDSGENNSDVLRVGGLPYQSITSGFGQASNQAGGVHMFAETLWSSNAPQGGRISNNSATISLQHSRNGSGTSSVTVGDMSKAANHSQTVFYGQYLT